MRGKTNIQEKIYLSKYIVNDPHSEYLFKQDFTVTFINEEKNIKKQIVDKDGNIFDFPGVEYIDKLTAELGRDTIEPIVKYEAVFEKNRRRRIRNGLDSTTRRKVPDGLLGFRRRRCGNFTMPFKFYRLGRKVFGDYRLRSDLE